MNLDDHRSPPQPWEAMVGVVLLSAVLAALVTMLLHWKYGG